MSRRNKLEALLAPLVADMGYEFVGIEYSSNPKNRLIRLFIDRADDGIGLEDCERVSLEVSALLDVEDPISGQYTLEVSSPGIERPLFVGEHFARFAGETARVAMQAPIDGRRNFKGRIVSADGEHVVLDVDGEHHTLVVADIQRAHLAPDLDALLAEDKR